MSYLVCENLIVMHDEGGNHSIAAHSKFLDGLQVWLALVLDAVHHGRHLALGVVRSLLPNGTSSQRGLYIIYRKNPGSISDKKMINEDLFYLLSKLIKSQILKTRMVSVMVPDCGSMQSSYPSDRRNLLPITFSTFLSRKRTLRCTWNSLLTYISFIKNRY